MPREGNWGKEGSRVGTWGKEIECIHRFCPNCVGSGRKIDGSLCIHDVVCICSKCVILLGK